MADTVVFPIAVVVPCYVECEVSEPWTSLAEFLFGLNYAGILLDLREWLGISALEFIEKVRFLTLYFYFWSSIAIDMDIPETDYVSETWEARGCC